jgi:hypothetical protein
MALCRWSDYSDIYAYATEYGYTIHDAMENSWYNCTIRESITLLKQLEKEGQKVPIHAFMVLQSRLDREDRQGEIK